MRTPLLLVSLVALSACGGGDSLAPLPTRYNFGVVDGANQVSTAGVPVLGQPITSQLTRHAEGTFARLQRLLLPPFAYAQGLTMPGTPVAGALVCAREAGPGEPQAFPLCAFTLADGKAPIEIKGGTKAGVHQIVFSAQVPSQQPVRDSTTVTVLAGPMASHRFIDTGFICWTVFPADGVKDQYGNAVPYRMRTTGPAAHFLSDVLGSEGARTIVADTEMYVPAGSAPGLGQPVTVEVATGVIATGEITQSSPSINCVRMWFGH